MPRVNIVYWEDEGGWIGYLQEYPDYWTQGETLEDLQEHLRDVYRDLTSGEIPGIRRVVRRPPSPGGREGPGSAGIPAGLLFCFE